LPPRLRWYVLGVIAAGLPVVGAAAYRAFQAPLSPHDRLGVVMFMLFALLAEWRPIPIDPAGKRLVSLAFIFVVATLLLFGWEWSVITGTLCIGIAMAATDGPLKVTFNSATYALAAGLAALPLLVDGALMKQGYGSLAIAVGVSGGIFVVANVMLVCVAIAYSSGLRVGPIFRDHLHYSGPIFGVMVFVAAQAVIFWRLSPPLVLLLGAPLFALTLYQRSALRHRAAEEAASTDSLTGLKNRRAFEEESSLILSAVPRESGAVALCLVDIDRFKQVNDRHGHLAGDAILQKLAQAIETTAPGRGYRLGGDEFVLLLEESATDAQERFDALRHAFRDGQEGLPVLDTVTLSGGIAIYPAHARDIHALKKRADMALYQSKYNGRDCATIYTERRGRTQDDEAFHSLQFPMVDIRVVTARRLAALVDAFADASADAKGMLQPNGYTTVLDRWRNFDGNHSQAVAALALELAQKLGVEGDELEHIRLAALLHDIGKVAVPEHILNKAGTLTEVEQELVQRHPVIGYELVRGLGLSPVDTFVLHHHERWDGGGYPHGLKGAEIPFGSRLIFVADAFDVLTSTRSYRSGVSVEAAMHELQSESGRQFDPLIVAALHELLTEQHSAEERATATDPVPNDKEAAWSFSTSEF
jgi:diguanylate cyclase (GGDEF)-like protein/putative nucleotidyltransferase with HDIG domain